MKTKEELAQEHIKTLPTLEYQNLTLQMQPAELHVFLQKKAFFAGYDAGVDQAFIAGYEMGLEEGKKNKITPELMERVKKCATKWP